VTTLREHGAIANAETLECPRRASSPRGTLCVRCAARTPLVVTPMQAVSAGPRRAPRSILPLTPSSCLKRRLAADAGGDEGVPGADQNQRTEASIWTAGSPPELANVVVQKNHSALALLGRDGGAHEATRRTLRPASRCSQPPRPGVHQPVCGRATAKVSASGQSEAGTPSP
jgi:hypothetical protein